MRKNVESGCREYLVWCLILAASLTLPAEECSAGVADWAPFPGLDGILLPVGFGIEVFAREVDGARSLCLGENGTVFVGSRGAGNVYALVDEDGIPGAETVHLIAGGLDSPNGVAFLDGDLFVAEIGRVVKFDDIENRLEDPPEPAVVNDDFPHYQLHGWKFISFGPDGKLYIPLGAPCNVCEPDDSRLATIMRMNPDGTELEVYARGVRNTVGFDWHPTTGELWFTDNGRDGMGDDIPPDELNRAAGIEYHFGFPYVHGSGILDPNYGSGHEPDDYVAPEMELGPHVAALGMRFYDGEMFPESYRGRIFIAEHGSWNRSSPIGYRVTTVTLEGGRAAGYEVFAEGWLSGGEAFGRPVDVLEMPDGSLLVSDDRADRIYRIFYRQPDE